jgi:hypothetical protein
MEGRPFTLKISFHRRKGVQYEISLCSLCCFLLSTYVGKQLVANGFQKSGKSLLSGESFYEPVEEARFTLLPAW